MDVKLKLIVYPLFIFLHLSHISCSQVKKTSFDLMLNTLLSNSVEQVEAQELQKLMSQNDIILLDTRENSEYNVSHINGAINVGYDNFSKSKVKNLPKDKVIVVYCSVGYRSEKIGEKLEKMGFENVKNLRGGIFDWKNEGNTVVNSLGDETEKVHTFNEDWSKWLWNGEKVYE